VHLKTSSSISLSTDDDDDDESKAMTRIASGQTAKLAALLLCVLVGNSPIIIG
jgi:hypothetical protein